MNKQLTESCIRYLIDLANGDIKPTKHTSGICYNLNHYIRSMDSYDNGYALVLQLAKNWKHNTGSEHYPIPQDENYHNLWNNPYRLELCRYIAARLSKVPTNITWSYYE